MKIGGDKESVIFIINRNRANNIGMATMQYAY
ncbi:Uncharacterised protein [Shigella sonnei]|nr:Uncharacterised protein [Shigella sonnei]CSG29119.1 Uncharacterised protein [Shigella sonnei]CSG33208.1 Uncharacterised protein [Shigella sonnei]CSH21209.1 Uncharacterised protein [Shigella sonnei]